MKLGKWNILTALVIVALLAYACVSLVGLGQRQAEAQARQEELRAELEQLQGENAALEYAIENADNPDVIADVARDKLGLVMPDDRLFRDGGN